MKFTQIIYQKQTEEGLFFIIQINSSSAVCPTCQKCSSRVHSRYCRNIDDLPVSGQHVHIQILSHKWFCDNPECPLTIFTERLSWIGPYQRKTDRLEKVIEKVTFSTNCLTAEKVCHFLHIPISHDTLLRRAKTASFENKESPFRRH